MKDNDGNQYFSDKDKDKEKCNLMEKACKDVFRITDEENHFDKDHSEQNE